MTTLDLPGQMAALEAVREELETALGGDENWRALHGTGAPSGDADPDRRDRDARLVRSLEANPLYLAWTNVRQAIDALRDADHADDAPPTRIAPSEDEARAIELPEDIRARIRVDAEGEAASRRPEPSTTDAELPGEQTGKGTLGRKLATIPTLDPVEAPASVTAEPVSAVVRTRPAGDLPPLRIEPAEAKVSFVRRQAPAGAAKTPAGPDVPAAAGGDAFVPAAATTEEAEVAIVSTPVRRFLKALSGD